MKNKTSSISTLIALTLLTGGLFSGCSTGSSATTPPAQDSSTYQTVPSSTDTSIPPATTPAPQDDSAAPQGDESTSADVTSPATTPEATTPPPSVSVSTYKDNTYNGSSSYTSPAGQEDITFSFTVKNDQVTAVGITSKSQYPKSNEYQDLFLQGIQTEVVGKKLDEIGNFSAVNGASLTGSAFNDALAKLKKEAKA